MDSDSACSIDHARYSSVAVTQIVDASLSAYKCSARTQLRLIPDFTHHRLALICPGLGCFNSNTAVSGLRSSQEASMVTLIVLFDSLCSEIPCLTGTGVTCRESKLSNMQRRLLGIAVTPEHADTPLRHRLTQPTQAQPAPQPMKSPLGAPNVSATSQVVTQHTICCRNFVLGPFKLQDMPSTPFNKKQTYAYLLTG